MATPSVLSGFILNTRPWKETSLLIDFFSEEEGRISLVSRGVKGSKKNAKAALLQPFLALKVFASLKHGYFYLNEVESIGVRRSFNGEAHLCALYCTELLTRLLPEQDTHPSLLDVYRKSLSRLAADEPFASVLRAFEYELLEELGYGISFTHTREGDAVVPSKQYWVFEDGVSIASNADKQSIDGQHLINIAQRDWDRCAEGAKRVFQTLLLAQLGDKPLQSRQLWLAKRRLTALANSTSGVTHEPNDE